jgi:hypothetical protein
LAFLRAVDATEADTLRVGVVQDFDGIAVEDGNNGAAEVSKSRVSEKQNDNGCQK